MQSWRLRRLSSSSEPSRAALPRRRSVTASGKSANNWTRRIGAGTTQAANVQGSQANTTGSAKFTLNLGVYLPALVEVLDGRDVPTPAERDCHVRTRVSFLLGAGDAWWSATSDAEAEHAGREMEKAFETVALPWLDRVAEPSGALAWLEDCDFAFHGPVVGAALALVLGDQQRALAIIRSHEDQMSPPRVAWALDRGLL